jgi:hypothetical protein
MMLSKQKRMLNHAEYIRMHQDEIEASYRKVRAEGTEDAAVLLLDADDESARAVVRTSGRGDEIDAHIAEGRRRGYGSLFTWGMPRTLAAQILADHFDEIAATLQVPGGDEVFWVVMVAGGSASAAMIPLIDGPRP